jgi:hypothetical protein
MSAISVPISCPNVSYVTKTMIANTTNIIAYSVTVGFLAKRLRFLDLIEIPPV